MTGLLLKDLYCLKQNVKGLIFILVIWGVAFLPQGNGGLLMIYLSMMVSAMYIFTLSSYDKQAKWDTYALSMPLTRANMVQEKYIASILMLIVSALVSTGLVILVWVIRTSGLSGEFLSAIAITLIQGAGMCLLYTALALPISLWLGPEKGRYIPNVLFAAIFFAGVFVTQTGFIGMIRSHGLWLFSVLAAGLAGVFFAASYFISLAIYRGKGF